MRRRRAIIVFIVGTVALVLLGGSLPQAIEDSVPRTNDSSSHTEQSQASTISSPAIQALEGLPVKGRAPKTGYERTAFGNGWATVQGCSTRNIILNRDLKDVVLDEKCAVVSGVLHDPYSGKEIMFTKEKSSEVQIDHVVALSDAWQKGAQLLTVEQRKQLANDPLELLAVAGADNQAKSDGDAATWLPKNKLFRCEYVARQIAIKLKYVLWVTPAEKDAMISVLKGCPDQRLP
jgi:hypothetical protein